MTQIFLNLLRKLPGKSRKEHVFIDSALLFFIYWTFGTALGFYYEFIGKHYTENVFISNFLLLTCTSFLTTLIYWLFFRECIRKYLLEGNIVSKKGFSGFIFFVLALCLFNSEYYRFVNSAFNFRGNTSLIKGVIVDTYPARVGLWAYVDTGDGREHTVLLDFVGRNEVEIGDSLEFEAKTGVLGLFHNIKSVRLIKKTDYILNMEAQPDYFEEIKPYLDETGNIDIRKWREMPRKPE